MLYSMLYIRRRCYVTPGAHKACCCFQPHSAVSHCSLAATKGSKAVAACGQAWSPVSLHEAWCQWYNAVDIPKHDLEGWILNIKFTRDPIILLRPKLRTHCQTIVQIPSSKASKNCKCTALTCHCMMVQSASTRNERAPSETSGAGVWYWNADWLKLKN